MFTALEAGDPRQVGRYRIVARLGAGGMGQVFLGRSPGGRNVAVKVVRSELAQDPGFRRRFAREVATARRVTGFFTAGVVDADPEGSPAWLATEYVPGLPLGDAVEVYGPWPERGVLALAAGLAEALEAIHAAGVVHRDLKPSNVLLAQDGPRVIDFGISVAAEASVLTQTGMVIGTPGFMSPEQLTGGRDVGPATDVFALGAVLVYTATGNGPFGTGSFQALNYRIVHEQPELGTLPPVLRGVVARCLAKEPEARPTVTALVTELAHTPGDDNSWLPEAVAGALREQARVTPPSSGAAGMPGTSGAALPSDSAGPAGRSGAVEPAGRSGAAGPAGGSGAAGPAGRSGAVEPANSAGATATPPSLGAAATPAPASPSPSGTPPHTPVDPRLPAPPPYQAATPQSQRDLSPRPAPEAPPLHQAPTSAAAPPSTPHAPTAPATPPRPARRPRIPRPHIVHEPGPRTARPATPASPDTPRTPKPRPHIVHQPNLPPTPPRLRPRPDLLPTTNPARDRRHALTVMGGLAALGIGYATWNAWLDGDGGGDRASGSGTNSGSGSNPGSDRSGTDATPGSLLWTASKPSLGSPASYGHGTLYVGGTERLYALDAADGRERWSFAFGPYAPTRTVLNRDNDTVYFADSGGTLRALSTAGGRTRWTYRLGGRALPSDPALYDDTLYIATSDSLLHAVDVTTGKQRWTVAYRTANRRAPAAPVVTRGAVYVGGHDGKLRAYDNGGSERWTFPTGGSLNSPVMTGQTLYVSSADRKVYAVDVETGTQRWAFPVKGEIGGLAVVGSHVYFHNQADTLYAVYTLTGKERWTYPLPGEVEVAPAADRGMVYLAHRDGTLRAIDTGRGKESWVFKASGRFPVPPTPGRDAVYFTTLHSDNAEPRLHAVAV